MQLHSTTELAPWRRDAETETETGQDRVRHFFDLGMLAVARCHLDRSEPGSALWYAREIEAIGPDSGAARTLVTAAERTYTAMVYGALERGERAIASSYADLAVALGADKNRFAHLDFNVEVETSGKR